MKTRFSIIKASLVGLLLFPTYFSFAQVTDIDDFTDFDSEYVTHIVQAVFCSDLVTLTATEGSTLNLYDSYEWYTISEDGSTETLISGQTTSELSYTPTQPGYQRFRVKGYNSSGCFELEDYTVYVLPEIQIALSDNGQDLEYCMDQIPTGTETIVLTANASSPNPNDDTFVYNYQWYRNGTAIAGATEETYTIGSQPGNESLNGGLPNVYTAYVSYKINDGGCEKQADAAEEISITVTPKPEPPTITVTGTGFVRP